MGGGDFVDTSCGIKKNRLKKRASEALRCVGQFHSERKFGLPNGAASHQVGRAISAQLTQDTPSCARYGSLRCKPISRLTGGFTLVPYAG